MGLRRVDARGLEGRPSLEQVLAAAGRDRAHGDGSGVPGAVASILSEVRDHGDRALRRLTREFDGVDIVEFRVPPAEVDAARERIPDQLRQALELAGERIAAYHAHEAGGKEPDDFESGGIAVRQLRRPVGRAGCYAPGGRARYPSTVLMCAVPARVAGVDRIVLCAPPASDGRVDDASLAAAAIAGVDEVYRVGGAQAVAAMAFGTESVAPTDVIVGPGNRYVAEAKRQVSGLVGVPGAFAGPSEVVVMAGPGTPPQLAAVDLVVQAEHGPDGSAWLVTWSESVAEAVGQEVDRLVEGSPRRADLEATLRTGGYAVVVDGPEQACAVSNIVAPEHLEILTEDAETLLPLIDSAGAVFLGPMSPASVGDYLAGPNHVLPTNRTARFASALRVDDFVRHIHAVTVTEQALESLGAAVVTLAEAEGLPAHAESVRMRCRG